MGAIWRKWDLHVHTPASLVQHYGGDTADVWEAFLSDLEQLPPEFKVLGINDYLFLDGYRKVLEARSNGRLSNIDLILPVIELRLDKFGGTDSHLSRVNFHVIFSDELPVELIQQQFLNALPSKYLLTPEYASLLQDWQALPTRESLIDLGERIIATVPEDKRDQYRAPLIEGFNNLNFRHDDIMDVLQSHYFRDKHLLAIGKTEWENIKWTDQSIAEKKHLLSTADIIFTAATNIIGWRRGREALLKAELDAHNRLLDCSDAHAFSSSANKDRIGNCFTWIKADATFQGLHQALKEADGRIYVGEEPPKLASVRQNRTKYIKNISIARQLEDTIDEGWFNNELVFSHDLVAIIGNKGNGKSALTDIVALLGNANGTDFSFLNKERFRHPRSGKAALYSATLQWENGSSVTRSLAVDVSPHEVPLIKYIPQQFFERICNETGIGETSAFDQELKGVIFSHVSESDRLGLDSLERLISYRTEVVRERIQLLQSELSAINETIISLEHQIAPDQVAVWEHQIEQKQLEISAHKDGCPVEIDPPQDTSNLLHTLAKLQKTLDELQDKIDAESDFLKEEKRKLAAGENVRDRINNFRSEYRRLEEECLEDITLFGVALTEVIALSVNVTLLEQQLEVSRENIRRSSGKLDPNGMSSLITLQRTFKKQREELSAQLADAEQTYSRYLRQLEDWKDLETALLGSVDTVGSLLYLERQFLDARTVLPQRLERERISRREKAVEIFSEVQRLVAIHRELYQPVQDFIASHDLTKERYNLHFQVQIVQHGFADRFLSMINQGMRGAYHGTEEGRIAVDNLLACHALNDESDLLAFLDEVMHSLQFDPATANQSMSVKRQLKKSTAPQLLYDFIFGLSYLQPKYELTLGGKSLNQLSPGERGVVLLIFYLLIDKNDCPLIIDQPEENLDSQSVYELLSTLRRGLRHWSR